MEKRPSKSRLDRRSYLKAAGGSITLATFAGCTGGDNSDTDENSSKSTPIGDNTENLGEFSVPEKNVKSKSDIKNASKRKIGEMPLLAQPQGTAPNQYEAAQIFAENMSKLGFSVPIQTMTQNTIFDKAYIRREPKNGNWWYWAMWELSPRVTRLDPDELLYNHHSSRQTGYNWMYWENEKYDKKVEEQRKALDKKKRQKLVYECQQILNESGPDNMLVYPDIILPYNSAKWDGITNIKGIGPANMLTFANAKPKTDDKEMVSADTAGTTFKTITPFGFGNELDIRQNRMIYDRLLWPTPSGTEFQNRLATNIEQKDDTTVVVDIRKGHNWHDGTEVLAEDVKFTYDFNNPTNDTHDYTTNYGGSLDPVKDINVNDDHRLTINLSYPFAPLEMVTFVRVPIAQKQHWEDEIQTDRFKNRGTDIGHYTPKKHVGSGPMKFDEWNTDSGYVRLTKYEDHYDPIKYNALITKGISGVQQAFGQLKSGQLDIITQFTGEIKSLKRFSEQNDNISLVRSKSCTGNWISINCDHPPNNIAEFRRAGYYCWDEEEIRNTIYNEDGSVGNKSYISPALKYWFNNDVESYGEDLQAAANELVDGGFMWDKEDNNLYMPKERWCLTKEEYKKATKNGDGFSREMVKCD